MQCVYVHMACMHALMVCACGRGVCMSCVLCVHVCGVCLCVT